MDDSCAVCADVLEWVAYGACGHRDVCSTCVARLRFICEDRRCCICKTESNVVFVTKALGDYTRMINDFTVLPSEPKEGRVGSYWYHEGTQAFFDDVDHYRMIKAMCRLSCSVCDNKEDESHDGQKPRPVRFRNIDQLKNHLMRWHKVVMCSLCLEGRKVFICEQKLYNRTQLKKHIETGDCEVDGTESERGGFTGHPICEFCRTPFYGDNELYSHMSTEHYTCHICQRQHPGQYVYYKNYDDLEIHFGREHFLCEEEGCLTKKFIVFQTEGELKRHNTTEHAGRMSRSKRSAALQIPTSFRYRRGNEQSHHRGRGQTFRREQSDNQPNGAIQESLETAHLERSTQDPPVSSSARVIYDADSSDVDPIVQPFESLMTTDSEASSKYLQALGQSSRGAPLAESLFPPLPLGQSSSQQKSRHEADGLPSNTMAAHLRRQNNRNASVVHSVQAWSAAGSGRGTSSLAQYQPAIITSPSTSRGSSGSTVPGYGNSFQVQARPVAAPGYPSNSSLGSSRITSRTSQSSSLAPNLSAGVSLKSSISDFPPVSSARTQSTYSSLVSPNVDDQDPNKSLVEKVRAALEHDEKKYSSFNDISGQYRQGSIDTVQYLDYLQQYGLSHLVLDLASLCPDAQKQKELIETYNSTLRSGGLKENGRGHSSTRLRDSNESNSKKGKGKLVEGNSSKDRLADNVMKSVKTLQSQQKPLEEVEVLSKDGYRASKDKSNITANELRAELRVQNYLLSTVNVQNDKDGKGVNKQRKKNSKFLRARLGDGSIAGLLDLRNSDPDPDPDVASNLVDDRIDSSSNQEGGLPVRGVWRKGGGQKLFH